MVPRRTLWQLGRFLYQGARRELLNAPDRNGEYELLLKLAPHWQKASGELRFLDVGANFADWSVELLRALGDDASRARISAFEPAPAQAGRAERAIAAAAGDSGLATVLRSAVGAHTGEVSFMITGDATGNSSIAADQTETGGTITVPCTTLDAFIPADCLAIHMIKVDTEGNDFNVIEGAKALFEAKKIEVLQFEYNSCWIAFHRHLRDVFELMAGTGYVIGNLSYSGIELHREWHPELERFFETNFVILREDLIAPSGAKYVKFNDSNVLISA